MTVTIRIPRLRSLALVLVGVVVGATLVAPVFARVSEVTVEPAAIHTRSVSCAGLSFYPATDSTTYANSFGLRVLGGYQIGTFRCDPKLPHRAVVQSVRFDIYATQFEAGNSAAGPCSLRRSALGPSTLGTSSQVLASVGTIGTARDYVRLTDSTIDYATISNTKYGYWVECVLNATGSVYPESAGIMGASVTYTITTANG